MRGSFPLAIAAGVLVVAYFGLAHQYFALRFGGRARIYFSLFLFLAWVVPLLAGSILLMASMPIDAERESQVVFSLSPVAGIGLTAMPGDAQGVPDGHSGCGDHAGIAFCFCVQHTLGRGPPAGLQGLLEGGRGREFRSPLRRQKSGMGSSPSRHAASSGFQAVPGMTGGLD